MTTNFLNKEDYQFSKWQSAQSLFLVLLRIGIGWHFLYEGISKFLFSPNWSSYSFLSVSRWIFADFFHWIAQNPLALRIVDFMNIWGLMLIGIALFFGVFTKLASASGVLLLSLYYVANPPFIGMDYGVPAEGQYLIVNKNLIELLALLVFLVMPSKMIPGIDRLWRMIREKVNNKESAPNPYKGIITDPVSRREVIKNLAALPVFGGFVIASIKKKGWFRYEKKFLEGTDAVSSATMKSFDFSTLQKLEGKVHTSKAIQGL